MKLPVIGPEQTSCGECTACCNVLAIRELGKPCFVNCEHLVTQGCSIYEQRPKSCSDFYCLYRLGELGPDIENRPDKLGFLLVQGELNGGKSCDVYQYAPQLDPKNRDRVNQIVAEFRARRKDIVATNIFPHNAKIGIPIDVKPPYPTETQHLKNLFRKVQEDVWFHIDPANWPEGAREKMAAAESAPVPMKPA